MSWKGQRKSYSGIFRKRLEKCRNISEKDQKNVGKILGKEQKMAKNGQKNIGECQTTEMNIRFG